MAMFLILLFVVSLVSLLAMFAFKYAELHMNVTVLPAFREWADDAACQLKALVERGGKEFEKLPPRALILFRIVVHVLALFVARMARGAETQAHRLADFVSHKHGFERRETNSEFLKKVGEAMPSG